MTPEQVAARLAARARDALTWQQRWNEANPLEAKARSRYAVAHGFIDTTVDPVIRVRVSEVLVLADAVAGVSVPVEIDGQATLWEAAG